MDKNYGLIIKSISGEYTILKDNIKYVCKPRGVFRYKGMTPKVGDYVSFTDNTITEITPRRNDLERPFVSNIDKAFLVFSVKEPDLNMNLLDRMLAVMEFNDIKPIIVFTKLDLLNGDTKAKCEYEKVKAYYEKIGYTTYSSSIESLPKELIEETKGAICCLAGQSGVGKSTLLNLYDSSLNLKTDTISYALGRGKHTTRHIELLEINGGFIIDTPGFGSLDFSGMDVASLSHSFLEFFEASKNCKYNMCLHLNEPNCKVKEEVENGTILKSRYENYLLFIDEIKGQRVVYRKNDGKKEIKK